MTVQILEAGGKTVTGSRMEITLITPGWGSSGYYSSEVLEAAATNRVFPAKTQMHIDHDKDGGVGSVATLAAYLTEDARWEPDWVDPDTGGKGRLVAEAKVTSKYAWLADLAEAIGTSIAAPAEVSIGEAEGRQGRIIESLIPGKLNRVDFVTVAGRGGRISEVLESAKVEAKEARNVGQWLEARLMGFFTSLSSDMYGEGRLTREENVTLSAALGEALTSFTTTVQAEAPQLFTRDLWEDPAPAATEAADTSSPPNPAGVIKGEESLVTTIQIEEADHRNLVEASSRVPALETERDAAREALKETNEGTASALVTAALEAAGVTAPKLAARLTAGFPVKENGAIDLEAFRQEVAESVAEVQVAGGAGTPRNVGESDTPATKVEMTKEDAEAAILKLRGLTPKGAN